MIPQNLNNLLLTLADNELFTPVWTPDILDEVHRNLIKKLGLTSAQADHRLAQMQRAFPHAVDHAAGYAKLVKAMTNDRKDRHVLAAAVASGAALIVTDNTKDFPARACEPHGVEILSADEFLLDQLDLDPEAVFAAMSAVTERNKRPPRTILALADALHQVAPEFGAAVTAEFSTVSLLEIVDSSRLPLDYDPATALFDPASAACLWFTSLQHRAEFPNAIAALTHDVEDWDLDRTADSLHGYSLTTGVHEHLEFDDVVYVKFIRGSDDHPVLRAFGDFAVSDFRVLALRRDDSGRWLAHGVVEGWPTNAQREARITP